MDEVRKYAIANFNPLPPCGGRLLTAPPVLRRECYFNPLPPCGGRRRAYALRSKQRHFNPLPPCGGRPVKTVYDIMTDPISIHSLRVEGDCHHTGFHIYCPISIHSLRVEGDAYSIMKSNCSLISIHSLRVEGDSVIDSSIQRSPHFNPLPPCGGRQCQRRIYG